VRTTRIPLQYRVPLIAGPSDDIRSNGSQRGYLVVGWLSLIGVLLPPAELSLQAGVNFTPGRICIILLFLPALFCLLSNAYRAVWSDFFAFATVIWIVVATVYAKGAEALLTAAGGESLDFLGAYMVGRAFLWHDAALQNFIKVLKKVTIALLLFALADRISGHWIIQDILASLVGVVPLEAVYRDGVVRAAATFDHPILLGAFFSLVSALFLYSNGSGVSRGLHVGASFLGCVLSLSSAALMSWGITVGAYCYDRLLENISWRWGLFWIAVGASICTVFLIANSPLDSVLSYLTLDPQTGYFRYLIWNAATARIAESPFVGFASDLSNNPILDTTVDCVWLRQALRFGIPMIVFLFLTNITAIWPAKVRKEVNGTAFMARMSTGFTLMLSMFIFIGLTVHFWNYIWIFWGLCLGIKVSLKQQLFG
jgi:hypothetical protein